MFGFDSTPPSTADKLISAIENDDAEAAVKLLADAGTPCQRLALAEQAKSPFARLLGIYHHADGTETLSLSVGRYGVVASYDQKDCVKD